MKRTGKTLLIIALCLLGFGILLTATAAVSMRVTGGSWRNNANTRPAESQFASMESISSLSLTLINEPIFIESGSETVTIEWSQHYEEQYIFTQSGDSLSLSRQSTRFGPFGLFDFTWFNWGFNFGVEDGSNRPVTVRIPDGMTLERANLSGANIRIHIGDIDATEIIISGANARVNMTETQSDDIIISGANIAAIFSDVSGRSIEISGANANASLIDSSVGTVELRGANAELKLNNVSAHDVYVSGANAEASIYGDFSGNVHASGANAEVKLYNISAGNIHVSGANARVTANLTDIESWGFMVDGLNAVLRVDGQRTSGSSGVNTIVANGINARIDVRTR